MIFCTRCGRYYSDGTRSCTACGADLATSGHATCQGYSPAVARVAGKLSVVPLQTTTAAPFRTSTAAAPLQTSTTDADSVFDRDKFLLRQKAFAIKEKYYVTDDNGRPLMFVERPALLAQQFVMLAGVAAAFFGGTFVTSFLSGFVGGLLGEGLGPVFSFIGFLLVLALTAFVFVLLVPKRHVTFYKDDSKTEKMLEIRQLNKIEFPYANFSILDRTGNIIGSFRKNVLFDYIRRRWQVKNSDGLELCTAKEDSIILSLLRRTGIPIFLLMRTNFIFLRGQEVIGEFNRKLTLLDRYVLDLTADTRRVFDRRIALALGVMLDTGERR